MRLIAKLVLFGALAACTTGPRDRTDLRPTADPSAVIATELAFARAAQEKGQWTAFREYATRDAVMFVPGPVNAQDWLRKQTDPPRAVAWQPHQVWSSCDGSLAVTKGAWQRPDGSVGYFTTVWQRQDNREYKWVMDQGDTLSEPLEAPEMIGANVAECGEAPGKRAAAAEFEAELDQEGFFQLADGATSLTSASEDGTLAWSYDYAPTGERRFKVALRRGSKLAEVLDSSVQNPG